MKEELNDPYRCMQKQLPCFTLSSTMRIGLVVTANVIELPYVYSYTTIKPLSSLTEA